MAMWKACLCCQEIHRGFRKAKAHKVGTLSQQIPSGYVKIAIENGHE